jgi:hypothetical protein
MPTDSPLELGFDFPKRGAALFEALPDVFTFDDLMQAADQLAMPSAEAVEHFRIMQREELVVETNRNRWRKNVDALPDL